MARSQALSHVAMSVPPGTLTEQWRAQVLDFYGEVFGWKEMDEFRLPDRLTISVGSTYINVRARDDAPEYSGYEHFGVAFPSADELRKVWDDASKHAAEPTLEPIQDAGSGYLSFRLHYLLPLTIEAQFIPKPGARRGMTISPAPPRAALSLPWDDPDQRDPVAALAATRAELGDTFEVASGRDRYLFVFSPAGLRAFYAVPERDASKGLADYRMLVRKLPQELFAGVRTLAHDLFGAQDVEGYLEHLDHAFDLELHELGDDGTFDAFALARRVGHRLGLACWIGDAAAEPPWFDRLVADLDQLDGADAFVHPDRMPDVASTDKRVERAALARFELAVGELLADPDRSGFLGEIARRWDDTDEPERTQGIARDVVLLHIATMTNLFAALGWTLGQLALEPDVLARVVAGEPQLLEKCALESTRMGQCSVMLRTVLQEVEIDDGRTRYTLAPGVTLATMLALTNTTAASGLERYDPDRWDGRRLRDEHDLPTREAVTTFGFGPHRCPAQRFSLSAITRTVGRLAARYELVPQFRAIRPMPEQIGGVARAADPCPIAYRSRGADPAIRT